MVVERASFPAIVTASNGLSGVSGGAIYHTAFLWVINTNFMGNEAGIEGPAVMSVGLAQMLYNVSFLGNKYHCPAGEYGYLVAEEARGREEYSAHSCRLYLSEMPNASKRIGPKSLTHDPGRVVYISIELASNSVCIIYAWRRCSPVHAGSPNPVLNQQKQNRATRATTTGFIRGAPPAAQHFLLGFALYYS